MSTKIILVHVYTYIDLYIYSFQMRLDFTNFVVTGPSISTVTVGQSTAGVLNGKGIGYSFQTNCL